MIFTPYEAGLLTANSYLSVEEADDIIQRHETHSTWDGYDSETKKMILIGASLALDGAYAYKGKPAEGQTLKFPRGTATLPDAVKMSVAAIALEFSDSTSGAGIVKRETISKFTTEYFAPNESGIRRVDLDISSYMKPYRLKVMKLGLSRGA